MRSSSSSDGHIITRIYNTCTYNTYIIPIPMCRAHRDPSPPTVAGGVAVRAETGRRSLRVRPSPRPRGQWRRGPSTARVHGRSIRRRDGGGGGGGGGGRPMIDRVRADRRRFRANGRTRGATLADPKRSFRRGVGRGGSVVVVGYCCSRENDPLFDARGPPPFGPVPPAPGSG